jgi:serine/threonine protein kinase
VWSLGVILYILLTGTPPFNGRNDREIIERVKAGRYSLNKPAFKYVSESGKDLLQKMLIFDPKKRPTAEQCYNHKWFKKENRLDKKKLDISTLENFRNFHVRTSPLLKTNPCFSTELSYREPSTTSWLITWPVKRRRRSLLSRSRLWILTETVFCPEMRSRRDTRRHAELLMLSLTPCWFRLTVITTQLLTTLSLWLLP